MNWLNSGIIGRRWSDAGLAAVLATYFLATGLVNVLHPLWEAPDEAQHYEYIRYLAEQRALPDPVSFEEAGANELHQVPLYYAVQALLVGWVEDGAQKVWHENPYVTWPDHPGRNSFVLHRQEEAFPYQGYVLGAHLARFVSSLMGAGTVVATYLIGRRLLRRRELAVAAAAFVAFTPGFAFSSATVNNDNGIVLLATLLTLHCLDLLQRETPRARDGLMSGLLLGAAVLTKLSGLMLVAVVGFAWLLNLHRWGPARLRAGVVSLGPLPLALALSSGWWVLAKWEHLDLVLRNSGLADGGSLLPRLDHVTTYLGPEVLAKFFTTYWGAFGWVDELVLPAWQNWALAALSVASLLGLADYARQRGWAGAEGRGRGLLLLVFFVALALYVFVSRWLNLPLAGVGRGRFLYPAIASIAVLLVAGLDWLSRGRWLVPVAAGSLACLTVAVPFTISLRSFPPPVPAWGIFPQTLVEKRLDVSYANGVGALGATADSWEIASGETLPFTFYWQAEKDLGGRFWATFQLVDATGQALAKSHAIPRLADFAPDLWQVGEVVPDPRELGVRPDARPGVYRLEVLALDAAAKEALPAPDAATGRGWLAVGDVRVHPAIPPELASGKGEEVAFGEQLRLVGRHLPTGSTSGQSACVDLLWQATAPPSEDYHVSLQLLDQAGHLKTQHDGLPYEGRYPPTLWQVGEPVPDRHCLGLAGVPAGEYQVMLVVYRPGDGSRLAATGHPEGALPLGRLTVANKP
ncbi:MAG: glycosyltransferase family 39 protein [Chloroflexota bacterium]